MPSLGFELLAKQGHFKKLKSDGLKVSKPAELKRNGIINQQNLNFNQFQNR